VWGSCGVGEEEGDGGGFSTEYTSEGMALALVEWAREQVMVNCFLNLLAMEAVWALCFSDAV
jgi:hypothetical protein